MAQALINLKADVLAPMRCEVIVKPRQISGQERWDGRWDNYVGCGRGEVAALVRSHKNELIVLPKVIFPYDDDLRPLHSVLRSSAPRPGSIGAKYDCHRSDLVQQFFLGRVSKLLESGWDDVLKNNDHYDAMLSMKKNNMRLYICRELKISHNARGCTKHELTIKNMDERKKSYMSVRKSRWMDLMPYFLKKWDISALHDEVGRTWSLVAGDDTVVQTQCGRKCNTRPPNFDFIADLQGKEFLRGLRAVEGDLNSRRPSWDTVSLMRAHGKKTIRERPLGPCLTQIAAVVDSPVWKIRPSRALKSAQPKPVRTTSLLMKSCDALQQIMRYVPSQPFVSSEVRLYYVMVISSVKIDASDVLEDLVKNKVQTSPTTKLSLFLVIVVMGDDADEQWERSVKSVLADRVTLHVVSTSPPFGRSIGLKIGYEHVRTDLEGLSSSSKHDAIVRNVFFFFFTFDL
jgi:hypothetical protein